MKTIVSVSAILIVLLSLQTNAQDFPITTYVPTVGDKLIFDYNKHGDASVVEATIATIYTGVNALTANLVITSAGKKPINRSVTWFSTPEFIENNFLGISTQKEILRIGNFDVETVRVNSRDASFWFLLRADGSGQYPELIKAVRGNRVLVNLRNITRNE